MSEQGDYDLKPVEKKEEAVKPKPGEPGWVEPVPVVEKADVQEEPIDPDVDTACKKLGATAATQ